MFDDLKASLESLASALPKGVKMLVMQPGARQPLINLGGNIPHDPASLTKLMVFYCALKAQNGAPKEVTISPYTIQHYQKNKNDILTRPTTLPFEDALAATIIASDNVASSAIAETLGKGKTPAERHQDFVRQMNDTAAKLEMRNTIFANASGLPPTMTLNKKQPLQLAQTTAEDMALLVQAIYRDFPVQANKHLEGNSVRYKNATLAAHHGLNSPTAPSYLDLDGVAFGAKTGFTKRALFNIASRTTITEEPLVIVLLGVPPILKEKAAMLVGKENLPEKRKNPDHDPRYVDGDAFRDAFIKKVVHLWHATIPPRVKVIEKPALQGITLPPLSTTITFESSNRQILPPLTLAAPSSVIAR